VRIRPLTCYDMPVNASPNPLSKQMPLSVFEIGKQSSEEIQIRLQDIASPLHRGHLHVHVHIQIHVHQEGFTKISAALENCILLGIPIATDVESVTINKELGKCLRIEFRPQGSNSGLLSKVQFDICIVRLAFEPKLGKSHREFLYHTSAKANLLHIF